MPIPRLTRCCCFSVRTGAKILAILGLIVEVTMIVSSVIILAFLPQVQQRIDEWESSSGNYDADTQDMISQLARSWRSILPYMYIIFGVCLVAFILEMIMDACMLHGVNRLKYKFMIPWLVVCGIGLAFSTVGAVIYVVMSFFVSIGSGFLTLIGEIIGLAIGYYFWLVVYSAHMDIKEDNFSGGKVYPMTSKA